MSEVIIETINDEKILNFLETIPIINEKYLVFLNYFLEKFKYHEDLSISLDNDINFINDKLESNKYAVINIISDNFLFCLEQISDHNSDYFIYQKEKIQKKNGKLYKNKLPKIGNKTLLKSILTESDSKNYNSIFKDIIDFFNLLVLKDKNNKMIFNSDYVTYIKDNFSENKNYNKIMMVFDNLDNILNQKDDEIDEKEIEEDSKKDKSKKNKSKKNNGLGGDFMKNLENTKIAELAKNISQKINIDDFPSLADPSKLLSSLGNPEEGGMQNLLKFVVGEVQEAFKNNNLNENDLVNEAQNIMGQFQNSSGFDPMSILSNNNIDLEQFANIFSKMSK
jgi:hypothetical protein